MEQIMKKTHRQVAVFVAVAGAAVLAVLWSPSDTAQPQLSPLAATEVSTNVMGAGPAPAGLLQTANDDPFEKAKRSAPVDELPSQF
jgi:hypothetical protein